MTTRYYTYPVTNGRTWIAIVINGYIKYYIPDKGKQINWATNTDAITVLVETKEITEKEVILLLL